jgi:hypothetical protein
MAIIKQPPRAPLWPWGGQRSVREKLVDPTQLARKKTAKKGDPRNPAIASSALLDFIGPAHSAEELRLPLPPHPPGHDADLEGQRDHPQLQSVAERLDEAAMEALDRGMSGIRAAPDRLERLKALLGRERQMLLLVQRLNDEISEIHRKRREDQKDEGF